MKAYFQLLINMIIPNNKAARNTVNEAFQPALSTVLNEKLPDLYFRNINEMHSRPDAERFVCVKNLRPDDLYYIILSGQDQLYTFSYLGVLTRLIASYRDSTAQQLLDSVELDGLRSLVRLAANDNTIPDFLNPMSDLARRAVIRQFIGNIDRNIEDGSNSARDIADALPLSPTPHFCPEK